MNAPVSIFWFRRDLRTHDNHGLAKALASNLPVVPVFIFDTTILNKLDDKNDARITFIHKALSTLQNKLTEHGSSLHIIQDDPLQAFEQLSKQYNINGVYTNHDYEPYAQTRDANIRALLDKIGIPLFTFKDQVIFEKSEVVKDDGTPYAVFTPYSKKWKGLLKPSHVSAYKSEEHLDKLIKCKPNNVPTVQELGFKPSSIDLPKRQISLTTIARYNETRDYPALHGTSKLGVHLRFGTLSIRSLVKIAQQQNETYLNELIWREFYMMILWHHPQLVDQAFKPKYDLIRWENDERQFNAWCAGKTGYPLVDAGMRELNATGYMHNRVRMVVASFLTKHLLIDWRWGEAYFAQKLLDFELASNNGGWQWAAGSGCDAAPYFRIFNPTAQLKKFDPKLTYVHKWVPEYNTSDYPLPIVDHSFARERALRRYKEALNANL